MTLMHFDDLQPLPQTSAQAEDEAVQIEREVLEIFREDLGMVEGLAMTFAALFVQSMRRRWGGAELYVPAPDRSARDAEIRRAWRGDNVQELMRRYDLSRARIYAIVGEGAKSRPVPSLETGRASR